MKLYFKDYREFLQYSHRDKHPASEFLTLDLQFQNIWYKETKIILEEHSKHMFELFIVKEITNINANYVKEKNIKKEEAFKCICLIEGLYSNNSVICALKNKQNKIIGGLYIQQGEVYVSYLYPNYRTKGLGKEIYRFALKIMKKLKLISDLKHNVQELTPYGLEFLSKLYFNTNLGQIINENVEVKREAYSDVLFR